MSKQKIAVTVGSPPQRICSVGAFARAEGCALSQSGYEVEYIEPHQYDGADFPPKDIQGKGSATYRALILHIPSIHDRLRPWNVVLAALKLRLQFRRAKFFVNIHEYAEAPKHWRVRARLVGQMADMILVNTTLDYTLISKWSAKVEKIALGPTLWRDSLLNNPDPKFIEQERIKTRQRVQAFLPHVKENDSLVVYGGLLTAGKGIEFLIEWAEQYLKQKELNIKLVIMGAFGPKDRDIQFGNDLVNKLRQALGSNFIFLKEPTDDLYADMLLVADLMVFPYDRGVSERRSSYLAACSNGANIWTTVGSMSQPMLLPKNGPYFAQAQDKIQMFSSLTDACREMATGVYQRRAENLKWANQQSWLRRVNVLARFF